MKNVYIHLPANLQKVVEKQRGAVMCFYYVISFCMPSLSEFYSLGILVRINATYPRLLCVTIQTPSAVFIVMLPDSKPTAFNEKHCHQYTDVKDMENVSS